QVLRAVLEEDTQRLGLIFADERGIDVAAAQAHVGADGAEDPAERVGTLPRRSEGTDGTAAGARDRAIIRVLRESDRPAVGGVLLLDLGEQLVDEEPRVVVAEAVVLVAAVEAVEGLVGRGLYPPWCDEDANCHRHGAAGDEAIEYLGRLELDAILIDVQA